MRARQKIRNDNIRFEVPAGMELEKRLQAVLATIYLLFNEGYSASKGDAIIRYELCGEAIRLAQLIAGHAAVQHKENVFALLSLMFLNASRFEARSDSEGTLLTMAAQNRSLWDDTMKETGLAYLSEATKNDALSVYHILAAISAHYSTAPDYASTDWPGILLLYDSLVQLDDSPIVLLNRAIVVAEVKGTTQALAELDIIKNNPSIQSYHLFYSAQAELLIQMNRFDDAVKSLLQAIRLATLKAEKDLLERKLALYKEKIF